MPKGVYQRRHLKPALERFLAKVTRTETCWLWTGYKDRKGYGRFGVGSEVILAHRWSYRHFKGPMPDGMQTDHLCRNPQCVNPDHLEAVTSGENARRGEAGHHMRAKAARITHCPQGHPYEGQNLIVDSRGARRCRTCEVARTRRWREQRKRTEPQQVQP